MVTIKTPEQIALMRDAGKLLAACHQEIGKRVRPGLSTWEIDQFVERYLRENGAAPEQKGYHGYPYATCASVNDVICHGFPSHTPLTEGDIVTIDMVVNRRGWLADSAWTYPVGRVSEDAERLLRATEESLFLGIEQAVPGKRIGDIASAIEAFATAHGLAVVRQFAGHGIGRSMHEDPVVPHYGYAGRGMVLREGMCLTIEPMLNLGTYKAQIAADGWTASTVDGSLSAQYEHTLAITSDGPLILTTL
ncbi:MAG: type I methionyl aminopeptidase [Bacilli bacterium]